MRRFFEYMLSVSLFVGLWQIYVLASDVPPFILPSPAEVFEKIAELFEGEIYPHLLITSWEVLSGFVIGGLLGFAVGYPLVKMPYLRKAVMPYLLIAQTAPKIALIPLFVIWFGLGFVSKLILIVSMVFFPVMAAVMLGIDLVPKGMRDLMAVLGASRLRIFTDIELPSSLPLISAGLKVGMVQAVIGAIVAEWISSKSGLGYLLTYASALCDTPLLIAVIIITIVLGIVFYEILDLAEKRLLSWNK